MFKPRLSFVAIRRNGLESFRFGEIGRVYHLTKSGNGFYHAEDVTYPDSPVRHNGWFFTRRLAVEHIMQDAAFHA